MYKISSIPRLINLAALFICFFLSSAPVFAQHNNNPERSLEDLFEAFKTDLKLPCGQRAVTIRIGKEIVERFKNDENNITLLEKVKKRTALIEEEEKNCQTTNPDGNSSESEDPLVKLFEIFNSAVRKPCGERGEAIQIGKRIVEEYSDDESNKTAIEAVKKRTATIEKEDPPCQRAARYNASYKAKNWREFMAVSKEIIGGGRDKQIALDVMLTLVSVGYNLTVTEKNDSYNTETVNYAKRAIELIESGVNSKSNWGFYESFKTREKALGWMNYIAGYVSYFRLKENKKAIPYFYEATRYRTEFAYDAFVYHAVAIYYFDKDASMASSLSINDFIAKASSENNEISDGTNASGNDAAKNEEMATLYKKLVDLYNLRYNLETDENVVDLGDYIQKLIERPLITAPPKEKPKSPTEKED